MMMSSCGANSNREQTAGIRLENLDTSVPAGDDFYRFATGGWQELHPLTDEYARFGSFDKLAEDNREQLKVLIEEIAALKKTKKGTIEQKIADVYNLAMDSVKLNHDGIKPARADLQKIAILSNKAALSSIIPELAEKGVSAYFNLYVDADPQSSREYLVQTYQGGIGMGEREYYLDADEHTIAIREAYKKHVANMFELFEFTADEAAQKMQSVLTIETRLATAAYDNVKLRDP